MWLDLKDIIEIPGAELQFDCELSVEALDFPSVSRFISAPHAKGRVINTAGVLTLLGSMTAEMICLCDRCGGEFAFRKELKLEVPLAADMEDEDDPEIFPVQGNGIELSEVLETCFILDMDSKFLCSDDCKGLCQHCGTNLNRGSCTCTASLDPRLAVLGQLLDRD